MILDRLLILYIGLGGKGTKLVSETKQAILQSEKIDEPLFSFLAIDIGNHLEKNINLESHEFISININPKQVEWFVHNNVTDLL